MRYTLFNKLKTLTGERRQAMLFENRAELIVDLLTKQQTVSIQDIVEKLQVSESTIRRDLIALEEAGRLRRIHGGATSINELRPEQKMSQKESMNLDAKQLVAQYVSKVVKPNSQIYVDAGTATLELIRLLPVNKNLRMVTNGLDQALLAIQRGIEVEILGGLVKPSTHAIAGIQAYQQLERMNFSYAFMGMNGIHEGNGLTTTNMEEALLKELAMQQSQNIRILMDDSKVNEVYAYKVQAPSQAIVVLNEGGHKEAIEKIQQQIDVTIVNKQKG